MELLHMNVLREYLSIRMANKSLEFGADEGLMNDFVFLGLFIGNDFLPALEVLPISEGGVDILMSVYQQVFPSSLGHQLVNGRGEVSC